MRPSKYTAFLTALQTLSMPFLPKIATFSSLKSLK